MGDRDHGAISTAAIEAQLDRILASEPFAGSARLQAFLRFVVDTTLAGRGADLKEYSIGVHVYQRRTGFDPKADSIVRSEARRLRARLQAYYAGPGLRDPWRIELPVGRYVPHFHPTAEDAARLGPSIAPGERRAAGTSAPGADGVRVAAVARRYRWLLLCLIVVVAIPLTLLMRTQSPGRTSTGGLVLIVPFDDARGVLPAGALETAIEFALVRSSTVHVVPPMRVQDGLRLMGEPAPTRLTPALAAEVAARDPDIDAVLTGYLSPARGGHVVTANLRDAQSGRALGTTRLTLSARDQAVDVAADLGAWLEQILTATPVARRPALERAATRSLAALHAYSRGMDMLHRGEWVAAESMFRDAAEQDPEFASALIYHAWTLQALEAPREAVLAEAQRADAAARRASERERLFIRASVWHLKGGIEAAAHLYEALVREYPDHYWGVSNLTAYASGVGAKRGARYWRALADLRPTDIGTSLTASRWLLRAGDFPAARGILHDARQLATGEDERFVADWLLAFEAWQAGDLAALRHVADRAQGLAPGPRHATQVGLVLLSTGRPTRAQEMFAITAVPTIIHRWSGIAAASRGDRETLRRHARALVATRPNALSTILLTWAGLDAEAAAMAARRSHGQTPGATRAQFDANWAVADGERLRAAGRPGWVPLLRRGVGVLAGTPFPEYYIAARGVAGDAVARGDEAEARAVLRAAVAQRAGAYETALIFWAACARDLATLERTHGGGRAAASLERELATLLEGAEPGVDPGKLGQIRPTHP